MVLTSGLERLLGWEYLPLYGRYGYVEMIKFLMIKIVLSCRISTVVPVCSALWSRLQWTIVGYSEGYFSLHRWPHNLWIGQPPSP
jgi:hypothetical protein